MARRKIEVQLIGDASKLQGAFKDASRSANSFGSAMKSLGKVAAVGVGGAVVGLTAILKTGFAEFSEGQKVMAQTGAVLKSTGGVANVTASQVTKLADSLSRMSGIDDEAIQANENLLLTFKNVRNEAGKGNKIFNRATKASLDLHKAGFGPLSSTAKMLGKVLNDPVKGISALGRAGVTFTEKQKKTIKSLVESNKLLDAQKIVLEEVESQVGGSAKAWGGTLPGALSKLRNAFEGVTGELARGLAPVVKSVAQDLSSKLANPAFVARVRELGKVIGEKLRDVLKAIGQWFADHWGEIKGAFRTAKDLAEKLVTAVGGIKTALQKVSDVVPGGGQTLLGAVIAGTLVDKIANVTRAVKTLRANLLTLTGGKYIIKIGLALAIGSIIWGPMKKFFEQAFGANFAGITPGGLIPVRRGGKWVDPTTGKPVADQEFWNRRRWPVPTGAGMGGGVGRAHGGPVMPGVAYRVGERGPETVTFGARGMVHPNGGGVHIETVNLYGVQNARQLLEELRRMSKLGASQTRGRYGGANLALG